FNILKNELGNEGKVISMDSNALAPAVYETDKYYIDPRITEDNYLDTILDICSENNIKVVLSLIDPELSTLAKHKQIFLDTGVTPIISDFDAVELCFDKYAMYEFLTKNNIQTVK